MAFKARPVRSNILKPLPRLGVYVSDWPWIVAAGAVFFFLPFALNIWVWVFPLGTFTGPGAAIVSFAFFNWVHKGKRPMWFTYQFKAVVQRWAPYRRSLPGEYSDVSWLK
jgi:hypothetical protein